MDVDSVDSVDRRRRTSTQSNRDGYKKKKPYPQNMKSRTLKHTQVLLRNRSYQNWFTFYYPTFRNINYLRGIRVSDLINCVSKIVLLTLRRGREWVKFGQNQCQLTFNVQAIRINFFIRINKNKQSYILIWQCLKGQIKHQNFSCSIVM